MKTLTPIVLALLFLCLALPSLCQTETATISGRVTDPQGAVMTGAEVQVQNVLTGWVTVTRTNSSGLYVVTALQPGTYRIIVSNPGFRQIVKPDVVLNVQDNASINFGMTVGSASETITVEGGAPVVNTQDASVGTVVDRQFAENLPLNGRSFNTLLQLTPGVVIAPTANYGAAPGQFSIAGQRSDANNFSVDGVSANFGAVTTFFPGQSGTGTNQAFSVMGGTSSLVSVDALQEFRVETSSFAPEFGRTPGGQVILTTRAGTNNFHGGLFDYFRNTVMDANDWFAKQAGNPRAPEHHNDFGGFLGGPIWKDRTFFFISYEGARLRLPQTSSVEVPSLDIRSASSTPTQLIPFLNAYPLPNGPISSDGSTAEYTGTFSNSASLDAASIRIDDTFNQKFSIFGRYNYAPSQLVRRVYAMNTLQTTPVDTQTTTIGISMLPSRSLTNTARVNYSTQKAGLSFAMDSFGGAKPLDPGLLLGTLDPKDNFGSFTTFDTIPIAMGPQARNTVRQLNFVDDLSVIKGAHQLKVGADYRGLFFSTKAAQNIASLSSFTVQSFVSTGTANLNVQSQKNAQIFSQAFSIYGQDTWRIAPRLTVTYGLRWEINPAPSARNATTLAVWNNLSNPSQISLAPNGTSLWRTTYGNIAPRIGLAYSLNSQGDFVVRGGAGIFYDLGVGSSGNLVAQFPNVITQFSPSVSVPTANINSYLPAFPPKPPYGRVEAFSQDLKLPRSYQWNVALEKSFRGNQVITATYLGQAGRKLLRQSAFYQPNATFSGVFMLTENGARSNYDALQLQYRKALSNRVQALVNYTWSHSLDNASNDVIAGISNSVISAANDYASSDFDVRHSLSGAVTYDIPSAGKSGPLALVTREWSVDTVVVARSGFPFNAAVLLASPVPYGYAPSRPDLVPGQPVWVSSPTAPGGKILNSAALQIPSTVRQGTEPRNDIRGFGLTQVDLSIARKFPITEKLKLQFRADAFNVFNHPNFTNPPADIEFGAFYLQSQFMLNQGLGGLNSLFQEGGPRSLQLSLKFTF